MSLIYLLCIVIVIVLIKWNEFFFNIFKSFFFPLKEFPPEKEIFYDASQYHVTFADEDEYFHDCSTQNFPTSVQIDNDLETEGFVDARCILDSSSFKYNIYENWSSYLDYSKEAKFKVVFPIYSESFIKTYESLCSFSRSFNNSFDPFFIPSNKLSIAIAEICLSTPEEVEYCKELMTKNLKSFVWGDSININAFIHGTYFIEAPSESDSSRCISVYSSVQNENLVEFANSLRKDFQKSGLLIDSDPKSEYIHQELCFTIMNMKRNLSSFAEKKFFSAFKVRSKFGYVCIRDLALLDCNDNVIHEFNKLPV